MENHYVMNVSLNGRHWFATAPHSIKTFEKAFELYSNFKQKFPVNMGYKVTCTYWQGTGSEINFEGS